PPGRRERRHDLCARSVLSSARRTRSPLMRVRIAARNRKQTRVESTSHSMSDFNIRFATDREIQQRALKVVAEVSGLDQEKLDPELSIAEDIAPNSIDRITLFMALEDEFGESIPESDVRDIATLGQLLAFIHDRVSTLRECNT